MAHKSLAPPSMVGHFCISMHNSTLSKQLRYSTVVSCATVPHLPRLLPHTVTIIYNKKADCNFEWSAQFYSLLYINLSNTQPAQPGLLTPWYMPWLHLHKSQSVPMVLYIHHVDVFLFPMLSHYILR